MASNAIADLENFKKRVKEVDNLIPDSIPEATQKIQAIISNQISSGTDPYGVSWEQKKDGGQALVGIEKYVSVNENGDSIKISLVGPAVFHQEGGKNLPQRKIIPDGELPETWSIALSESLRDTFNRKIK